MMVRGLGATPDFSVTVYGAGPTGTPPAAATHCDPFWSFMNGGYCSDALGNYIRRDGSPIQVGGVAPSKRWMAGVSNEMVLGGLGIVAFLLFAAAVRR